MKLCYCTNVHAGVTYDQTLANLERYAVAVKQQVSPRDPMGVGLWLSAEAARQVVAENQAPALRDWLSERGLAVFTLNGFPHGNFHDTTVKHRVYRPDWRDPDRLSYTLDLVRILAELLPEGGEGSISTLPLGWRSAFADEAADRAAAAQLLDLVHHLARSELDTGKYIHVDLEPEPGCRLDTSADVVSYFERYLLDNVDALSVRGYLRICHDVCHSAVMFEDQADALAAYRKAGLKVGKVQISSAVRADFAALDAAQRTASIDQLAAFGEQRYLHQTCLRQGDGSVTFYDDLPDAVAALRHEQPEAMEARVHFHVPLFLERFGALTTTQDEVGRCLAAIQPDDEVHHFEVETYAWEVLPDSLRTDDLAAGIAREMQWAKQRLGNRG